MFSAYVKKYFVRDSWAEGAEWGMLRQGVIGHTVPVGQADCFRQA